MHLISFFLNLSRFIKEDVAQIMLLRLIEGWKKSLEPVKNVGVVLMDLIKAFNT